MSIDFFLLVDQISKSEQRDDTDIICDGNGKVTGDAERDGSGVALENIMSQVSVYITRSFSNSYENKVGNSTVPCGTP